jgi:hypothetical protein
MHDVSQNCASALSLLLHQLPTAAAAADAHKH